jgi:ABC-2 type transport system ATP-binding protein
LINAFEIYDLTKKFGDKTVLDKINLKIEANKIHGLIGLNGVGKSTLLKILSGMADPTSGSFRALDLTMPTHLSMIKSRLGYLPENPTLYGSLSVYELLRFIGKINEVPKDLLEERIEKYSRLFDIVDLSRVLTSNLSVGENQKVALCTILIKEPQIYLLDDPFNSLDPLSQLTLRKIFSEKIKGSTILFSTHYLQFIENLCDRVILLDKGRLVYSGDVKEFTVIQNQTLSLEDSFIERLRG